MPIDRREYVVAAKVPYLGEKTDMDSSQTAFQTLKPICVDLSKSALILSGPNGGRHVQTITDSLEQLRSVLNNITASSFGQASLDPKLADYVFFPLSQLLKHSKTLPIRFLELCLQCITILVSAGWRQTIEPALAAQLVILCTLLADRKPKSFSLSETTDELQSSAFECLGAVFGAVGGSQQALVFFRGEAQFPQLGQTITTLLDGVLHAAGPDPQTSGLTALEALVDRILDRELAGVFLPGIVSKLVKILTPQTKARRPPAVLVKGLEIVRLLLLKTLRDAGMDRGGVEPATAKRESAGSVITAKWKETASTQLKSALTSILRLQSHARPDVQDAVTRICFSLLSECRMSLESCSPLALETLLSLSSSSGKDAEALKLQLEMLFNGPATEVLAKLLQSTLYDWLQALPNVIQGSDDHAKVQRLRQIQTAYGLLDSSDIDKGVLDRMIGNALRDSVVLTLQEGPGSGKGRKELVVPSISVHEQIADMAVLGDNSANGKIDFGQTLVRYRGQDEVMNGIGEMARLAGKSSTTLAGELARSLRYSIAGERAIAEFWLLLTATENALAPKSDPVDVFIDFAAGQLTYNGGARGDYEEYLEELYSLSLNILTSSPDNAGVLPDVRLQTLALRALALRAKVAGQDFRGELIDALHPVLHTLATPSSPSSLSMNLQQDAVVTLNIFAASCGYADVKELIVENVDYLTNAVSLKLNSFDLDGLPQACRVLSIMVKLAGPSLVVFLEDVVEALVGILESYHGYVGLSEGVWTALAMVVGEGVKTEGLKGHAKAAVEWASEDVWRPMRSDDVAALLRERKEDEQRERAERLVKDRTPQKPWKVVQEIDEEDGEQAAKDDEDDGQSDPGSTGPQDSDEAPPPAPKTYALLLRLTDLTQHYLPSASPSLRTTLLSLLRTTIPALARHENSFLPLINTLWPEIVSKLESDEEAHVRAGAIEVVGLLCEFAGSFMRSRIEGLWGLVTNVYHQVAREIAGAATAARGKDPALVSASPSFRNAVGRLQASPTDYTNTTAILLWEALITGLTKMVRYVPLGPTRFDDALEMLAPVMGEKPEVRKALEIRNADAVWLMRVKMGTVERPALPALPADLNDGLHFVELAAG